MARRTEFAADMLCYALVVAAEDLDADTFDPKRGDGRPRARLWRVEEHHKAGKDQLAFVSHRCRLTVGLQVTPSNAECAKSLRAELLENYRRADPRRIINRQ